MLLLYQENLKCGRLFLNRKLYQGFLLLYLHCILLILNSGGKKLLQFPLHEHTFISIFESKKGPYCVVPNWSRISSELEHACSFFFPFSLFRSRLEINLSNEDQAVFTSFPKVVKVIGIRRLMSQHALKGRGSNPSSINCFERNSKNIIMYHRYLTC